MPRPFAPFSDILAVCSMWREGREAEVRGRDDPIAQQRWKPTFGADEGRGSFCAAARRHRATAVNRYDSLVEALTHLDRDHYDLKSLPQNVLGKIGGVWPVSVMGAEHSFKAYGAGLSPPK
ncbi:hypothetical protein [Phaeovulum sp. W22_SRMD_FR3]|uniref:hypothetical protein n=1 Tax=Phaeovulum sp. W22_SRMD_FR3 TaxID=3240274 RepID=UPI003F9712BE